MENKDARPAGRVGVTRLLGILGLLVGLAIGAAAAFGIAGAGAGVGAEVGSGADRSGAARPAVQVSQ